MEAMRRTMKPGKDFMWRPLVRGPDQIAATEPLVLAPLNAGAKGDRNHLRLG